MFETPTLDIQELRSVLTDAGHTAVGFATMAAKKANDVRLDFNGRYDEQTKDLRTNMLTVVEKFADVRTKVEARIDPMIETFAERLPAPARKVVENLTDSVKEAQNKAHQFVVDALTVEATKPAVKKPTVSAKTTKAAKAPVATKTAATKTAAKKTAAKTTAAKTTAAKTTAAKKTAAKKTAPATRKTAATKTVAKKTATKPAARKAASRTAA